MKRLAAAVADVGAAGSRRSRWPVHRFSCSPS
jgi:hypothetical protein